MTKKQNDLDEKLKFACNDGECKEVKKLIKQGANPNAAQMQTPLIEATFCHDESLIFDTIKVLIDHGADPNFEGLKGNRRQYFSPLIWLQNRNIQIMLRSVYEYRNSILIKSIEYLLKDGADPDSVDHLSRSSLLLQIENMHFSLDEFTKLDSEGKYSIEFPIIKLLLKHGASLELKDKDGNDSIWHLRNNRTGQFKLTEDNNIAWMGPSADNPQDAIKKWNHRAIKRVDIPDSV